MSGNRKRNSETTISAVHEKKKQQNATPSPSAVTPGSSGAQGQPLPTIGKVLLKNSFGQNKMVEAKSIGKNTVTFKGSQMIVSGPDIAQAQLIAKQLSSGTAKLATLNGKQVLFSAACLAKSDTKGENLKSDTKDKTNCIECVEKTNEIQTLKIANDEAKRKFEGLEESNTKHRKLRLDWAVKVSQSQNALEETKVECVEKTSKIQTLEIAKIKLETEVTSAQKALEESKAESKVELEKVENQLETEAASKKSLEESLAKYRKLRQDWVVKVYQSDPSNEDLDILLSLEPEKLFKKYEQLMKETTSDRIKLEEITETLQDVKNKLKLQTEQRTIYEKQLSEIRAVLHLPAENCNFANILPVVKDLLEQNETNHCSNGLSIVESSAS